MPNSENGLCSYHLVSKGIKKLKPKLTGWDQDIVKNQITTFKHWLYSCMGPGSIET